MIFWVGVNIPCIHPLLFACLFFLNKPTRWHLYIKCATKYNGNYKVNSVMTPIFCDHSHSIDLIYNRKSIVQKLLQVIHLLYSSYFFVTTSYWLQSNNWCLLSTGIKRWKVKTWFDVLCKTSSLCFTSNQEVL